MQFVVQTSNPFNIKSIALHSILVDRFEAIHVYVEIVRLTDESWDARFRGIHGNGILIKHSTISHTAQNAKNNNRSMFYIARITSIHHYIHIPHRIFFGWILALFLHHYYHYTVICTHCTVCTSITKMDIDSWIIAVTYCGILFKHNSLPGKLTWK